MKKYETPGAVKWERGGWQVVRNCCTSGNCATCVGAMTGKGAKRIVQADGYSEAYAKYVAKNWASYKAVAEPMTPPAHGL